MVVALTEDVDNLRATVTRATEEAWVEVAGSISLQDAAGNKLGGKNREVAGDGNHLNRSSGAWS
jgi:hypothetical protein